jgi:hypothetical protein
MSEMKLLEWLFVDSTRRPPRDHTCAPSLVPTMAVPAPPIAEVTYTGLPHSVYVAPVIRPFASIDVLLP